MLKLARWSTTHRLYIAIGWVILLIGVNFVSQAAGGAAYSNNFTLPNSDAQRASNLLAHSFPAQAGDRDTIVFKVAHGNVREAAVRAHMSALFAKVSGLPHVTGVISPYAASQAGKAISANGQIAFATVVFNEKANELPKSAGEGVVKAAEAARTRDLDIQLGGQAIEQTEQEGFGLTTAVGLMAAIVVLLITFGSVVAMGLPIITALFGLGTGLGLIALFTHVVDTPNFSSELAAMIGLGVGIDYSLFILTRFREAYATPGPSYGNVRESVVQAMDTAGRAVLFAGCTVVIALLGMMLLGVDFLYGVAISASIGVLLVMLGSLTLLPALLTIAGNRVVRPSRRARGKGVKATDARQGRVWLRWSQFVQSHSWSIAIAATLLLLLIAAPATALRLGSSDASNDPEGFTTYKAYELLAEGFGQGFNGPLQVVAQVPGAANAGSEAAKQGLPSDGPSHTGEATLRGALPAAPSSSGKAAVEKLRAAMTGVPDVAAVAPAKFNPTGDVATISVYPTSSPQAYATTQLVSRLRGETIPPVEASTGMHVYVGGVTAGAVDFATVLGKKLPLFIGVVVLLSALLLMIVFRSLVIPLQAACMNLLSIGASLGVIVVVFQWAWFDGLVGVKAGPIESFVPVMLFAIVFGLSMDYEVFLISRIHEQWTRVGDSRRAVSEGLALTGRVVTAAAAIMICVFLSFMLGESRVIKEFGLALASAVFLDAIVVRCLLLPAVLHILGDVTWAIPGRLERLLPHINIEGGAASLPAPRDGESPAEQAELAALSAGEEPVPAGARGGTEG
jgi:RND superfamily putative drug exporter